MSTPRPTQPPTQPTNTNLPEGWALPTLGQAISPSKEKIEPAECPTAAYLSLEHIESGTGRILGRGVGSDVASTKAVFRAGDILYGKLRPYLNKVCIPDFDGICSTDIIVFPRSAFVDGHYLQHYLMLPRVVEFANHNSSGVQLPRIKFEKLAELELPLPPLPEQKRIVAKAEELLERVNSARARLAKIPEILKRFRQSVLAAACSGQLTANWRIQSKLSEWQDTSLGDQDVEIRTGPFGTTLHKSDYEEGGVPLVNPKHIQNGYIRPSSDMAVGKHRQQELARYRLHPGDVVLGRRGEMGRSAVVTEAERGYFCGTGSLVLKVNREKLSPAFLSLFLRSPQAIGFLQSESVGSTMTNLNQRIVRTLPFPSVSITEQHEVVRRVEALFALTDRIEKQVQAATMRAEGLPRAILARAFRGELVPTEAELAANEGRDYEPASVLLERIRQIREQQKSAKRRRGGKKMARIKSGRRASSKRRPLGEVLSEQKRPLTPEQLFDLAGFDENTVDDFYEELRSLVREGKVQENRPNEKDISLEVIEG